MKFARRMQRTSTSPSMALADRVRRLRERGTDIINFGTRPDVPTHVKQAAASYLESPAAAGYTDARGLRELRHAIAAKLARENALDVDPDREVLVTAGAKQAIFTALMALVDAGDEVLVEDPGWVSFTPIVHLTGATPVAVPLHQRNDFVVDAQDVRERITAQTRVLVLCNPHNPTGATLDKARLRDIARVAVEHDLVVVMDEAYERLVYDGASHVSMASLHGMRDRTVTVQSTSKVYNMGGWRVGWITAMPDMIEQMLAVQSNLIGCATSFAQAGAVAALNSPTGMGDQPVADLLRDLSERRDFLARGLRQIPGVFCVGARGGFFMYPAFSSFGLDSIALSRHLLEEAGIATVPGAAFGTLSRQTHLRVLFTSPIDEIERGLERMARSLNALRE